MTTTPNPAKQDNQICTLKGSLEKFTFLQQLDLSGNALRDLEKLLVTLQHFKFMTHLNLAVRRCRRAHCVVVLCCVPYSRWVRHCRCAHCVVVLCCVPYSRRVRA